MLNQKEIEQIILAGGGEIPANGVGGTEQYGYFVYFNCPVTKSTLMLHLSDLSVELVKRKLRDKQELFAQTAEAHSRVNLMLWLVIALLIGITVIMVWKNQDTADYKRGLKQLTMLPRENNRFGEWLGEVASR